MESPPIRSDQETRRALAEQGWTAPDPLPPRTWFGDGPEMADRLAELVRLGIKTATSSLVWEYEAEGSSFPRPGDREIVVDGAGEPRGVIEVREVRIIPFEDVDAAFARDEGEGDLSLSGWREGHWRFFTRACAAIGRAPDPRMPIVCVRFRTLHAAPDRETR